jgi:hypothetical protein
MLFVHEVHQVVGAKEDEFEALFRDEWMPTLAQGDDARLLWYMNHAHGSGPAYNVVTITGVQDGAAWQRLDERLRAGDLRDWVSAVDACRHDVTAKVMLPVHWSPIQEVDFADVPTDGQEHALHLFMEDTGWPTSSLDEYIQAWDDIYRQPLLRYGEGVFLGYRWYEARHLSTRFPFGHGLSYSSFAIGEPTVSTAGDDVTVHVAVTNTGARRGCEVVQCYVAAPPSSITRPPKELKAFAKVWLAPGEQTVAELTLDARAFAYWDPSADDGGDWHVEPGTYELQVGRSSADIAHVVSVER